MKMLGKTGHVGFCYCCNWPTPKQSLKRRETRQWQKELDDELDDCYVDDNEGSEDGADRD